MKSKTSQRKLRAYYGSIMIVSMSLHMRGCMPWVGERPYFPCHDNCEASTWWNWNCGCPWSRRVLEVWCNGKAISGFNVRRVQRWHEDVPGSRAIDEKSVKCQCITRTIRELAQHMMASLWLLKSILERGETWRHNAMRKRRCSGRPKDNGYYRRTD